MGLSWLWLSALCYSNHFLPWAKTWLTHNLTRCHHLFTLTLFMHFWRHILFSFRWSRNEFGNGINKDGNDEKISNPPANGTRSISHRQYVPNPLLFLFFYEIHALEEVEEVGSHAVGRLTSQWPKWYRIFCPCVQMKVTSRKSDNYLPKQNYFDRFSLLLCDVSSCWSEIPA